MELQQRSRLSESWVWLPLGAYAVACLTFWVEPAWRPGWDSGIYVLTGRSLALGEGYTYLGRPFAVRPPGFAWLLSWVMPEGRFDPAAANGLVMFFAAVTPMAIYAAFRDKLGRGGALATALLAGTCPLIVGRFNFTFSEFPFFVLLFASFKAFQVAGRRGPRWGAAATFGSLALAAAVMLRTAGLVAIPGVFLVGLRRDGAGQRWRAVLPAVATLLMCLPWLAHSFLVNAELGRSDQLMLTDYTSALVREEATQSAASWLGPEQWFARVADNSSEILVTLGSGLFGTDAPLAGVVVLAVSALGVASLWRRRLVAVEDFYAFAYAGVLVVYFATADRLVAAVIPFVYAYWTAACALALSTLRGRWPAQAKPAWLVATVPLVLFFALNLVRLPAGLGSGAEPDGARTRSPYERLLDAQAAWLRENTPANAVLLSGPAPMLSVMSGRVSYTHKFRPTPELLTRYRPDYALFASSVKTTAALEAEVKRRARQSWTLEAEGSPILTRIYALDPPPRSDDGVEGQAAR